MPDTDALGQPWWRRIFRRSSPAPTECQGADFSAVMKVLGDNLVAHADEEFGHIPLRRAVFLARGGHAPGERCAIETYAPPEHVYWCMYPDEECQGLPCTELRAAYTGPSPEEVER